MLSLSEIIRANQEIFVPQLPQHKATDELTVQIMDWISRETKMALSAGDIWVEDDPQNEDFHFGFATPNGETAMGILAEKIETGALENQFIPLEPPELVLG